MPRGGSLALARSRLLLAGVLLLLRRVIRLRKAFSIYAGLASSGLARCLFASLNEVYSFPLDRADVNGGHVCQSCFVRARGYVLVRAGIRPTEASEAAVRYVRFTSIAGVPGHPLGGQESAQLRRPGSRSARSAKRRSAPFDRSRPTSAQGQAEDHTGLVPVGRWGRSARWR